MAHAAPRIFIVIPTFDSTCLLSQATRQTSKLGISDALPSWIGNDFKVRSSWEFTAFAGRAFESSDAEALEADALSNPP